jgi:hypothetical protein
MQYFILQAGPPPPPHPAVPMAAFLFMIIPVTMVLTGMVLGFRALRDIRLAGGTLGGAMTATIAAGLLPAAFIVIVCGGGLTLLVESIAPASRSRSEAWMVLGAGLGLWISAIMMRGMYREATGWVPPRSAPDTTRHSALTTAAIVLTIVGGAIFLLLLTGPRDRIFFAQNSRQAFVLLDTAVLLAGLTCGVLGRREAAAKTCAWICGSLFVFLLLIIAA